MKIGHVFANGWTLRQRYPFADGFTIEFELESPAGDTHRYKMDRFILAPGGKGPQYLYDWIEQTMGEAPDWR